MRIPKGALIVLIIALHGLAAGCAARRTMPAALAPQAGAAKAQDRPYCPDRVDKARTGGFIGTVIGTIAASMIGSPVMGGLYRVAGYMIGFASASTCAKSDAVVASGGPPSPPVVSVASEIRQEDL